jgi:homoserine kinase
MNSIKIFCPASVANVSCGFDVLGFCLEPIGDEMIIHKTSGKGVRITKIVGADIPKDPKKNIASVAALALLENIPSDFGFDIEIYKNIKPGSGIGSSAASAAGAVFGINELLGSPFKRNELIKFALAGEKIASGSEHADNLAPVLLGGFTLIRSNETLDVIKLPTPPELVATILHPEIELKTSHARKILKKTVPLDKAIRQWGNLGALVSSLYTNDYELLSRSLEDYIIEPRRSMFIPEFYNIKNAAINAGALGAGISGAGPSVYALSKGDKIAVEVGEAMQSIVKHLPINYKVYVSKINLDGVKIISSQ